VADRKPPRVAGDERATLLALLQYQRDSLVLKVTGVDAVDAAASPVPSGTSLLWLANHMGDAETTWVLTRFAGRPDPAEPHATDADAAVRRYRRVWEQVATVLDATASLDSECPPFDDQPIVDLRWILTHLLQETARHAGHADVLRELVDGSTGR